MVHQRYFRFWAVASIVLFMNGVSAFAQNNDAHNNDEMPQTIPSVQELIDYNIANNAENGFSAHKQNYVLPYAYSDDSRGRENQEVKFQISIKQRVLRFYGWALYFGYTQKSFWQAYDFHNSRPFRENNFNPEVFLRTKMWGGLRTDFGFEHESNGQQGLASRSWNRLYFTPYYENEHAVLFLKGWWRFREKKKKSPTDSSGDDNPDINKYYGYAELGATLKFPELHNLYISTVTRYNFKYRKGSVEVDATFPGVISSMSLMVQYWDGYGESLIDYNVKQRKIGFGVNFTR
ncbi:MAG TPA: phospholipase A [Spirochaetota bacterium]